MRAINGANGYFSHVLLLLLLQPTPGGKLVMFGGSVQGEFKELQPPNRIVMNWRFNSWEEGCSSQVRGYWGLQGGYPAMTPH